MNLYRNDNLRAAFDLYVRRQDALLPTEEELSSVTLSSKFHARMAKLLTLRKRGYYHMFGTWGRRVATIVVALLVAATITTASVEALRERVMEFFARMFETHTVVTFVDDTPDVPDEVAFEPRKPSYIPAGYTMEKEMSSPTKCIASFVNEEGDRIHYKQHWRESGELRANTEGIQCERIVINGYAGVVYNNKGVVTILFSDDRYTYACSASDALEELIKIAESIQ